MREAQWNRIVQCTRLIAAPLVQTMKYGVGLKYDFNKKVGLVAEWERYTNVGDDNRGATDKGKTGQSDMDFLSIGIRYNFSRLENKTSDAIQI